ncbi:CDP-6-deoxy-delta-3,4-glucoseen reductase [Uliginosibacterium sp. H3]|uniref:CDP-6-deoxy-delta-3,4-glucoseen reductase n=1 Tax=Uliginosibacterium silvisoli TaxID=3114758 RepID=A0ABU6K1Z0_9RHOO|nr:CDP-6-deoxy-delta-3,4-glucoseen reductase [Uliginosibacterium sp. H3]
MSFKVTLQPTGHQFPAATDTTILQAALDAELVIPYGCKDGACGSCKARVISGQIDHGRSPLTTLSADEREKGMGLMCCAHPMSDVEVECREVRRTTDIPIRKLPCRVQSLTKAADDVMVLSVKLPANDPFRFMAGQYIDFLLPGGKRRSFSMANPPHQAEALELHIRNVEGGFFTSQVFSTMKERDILRIEGPLGGFYLHEGDKPIIFLAGGTGFAPIKSIIEDMAQRGIRRPVHLYWGSRDLAGLYQHELAQGWARELADFSYVPVISDAQPEGWTGRTGFVHEAVMADHPDLSGFDVYACGAPAMIDAARRDFSLRGNLHADAFFADAFTFSADNTQST